VLLQKPDVKPEPVSKSNGAAALKGKRAVYFEEKKVRCGTRIRFNKMRPGTEFGGPDIIETPVTTAVANPRDRRRLWTNTATSESI
jgi:N-methylhydantoinase A/oxoprolinase/acetone carboxylase beta subunit